MAGRTGRAGSTGISVVLVDRKKESLIPFIERKAGLKFERIGAPQPQDVARIAANRAVEAIRVRFAVTTRSTVMSLRGFLCRRTVPINAPGSSFCLS